MSFPLRGARALRSSFYLGRTVSQFISIRAPLTELDIWRTANALLKQYQAQALFIASKRADALLDQATLASKCTDAAIRAQWIGFSPGGMSVL